MAGSVCPEHLLTSLIEKMNMKQVTVCYGLTEASPVVSQTRADDSFESKTSSIGVVHPHVEGILSSPLSNADSFLKVKLVDKNNQVVPIGEEGELIVKGYNVMKGYYGKPEETNKVMRDGFLLTGDLATMDEKGFLKITGRKKDLIIRGGENISPREIEDAIYENSLVKDVAVVGIPGNSIF